MSAERAIYALLSGDAAVAAIVATRIYPLEAPRDARAPLIIYARGGGNRWRSLTGPSGLAQAEIQVDAYAAEYEAVKDLARAVRHALDGFRGRVLVASDPDVHVRVGGISLLTDRDMMEDAVQPKLHRVSADYLVTHDEDQP